MPSAREPLTRRLARRVRGTGALVWLGLAWLAGPLPGHASRGTTGQPSGELWWWHLAAAVLVLVAFVQAVRAGELAERLDRTVERPSAPGRRWRTVLVSAWLALAVLAAAQALAGTASWGHVATFVAAATIAGLAPARAVGGEAVPRLAVGGLVLAVSAVGTALLDADVLEGPFAYYRLKQQVVAPVAAHNVLAGFLLATAPAAALASVRHPRRWWPALGLLGLGLAATLSRGALVAGGIAVVVAWFVVRDRTLARRLAVVVGLGAIGTTLALTTLGAAVPDDGGAPGPTSVVARSDLWNAALEAGRDRPVTGVGLDGFLAFTTERGLAAPHEHAHDLPLHAAATVGIPGLLAELAVWLALVAGAHGMLDRDRRTAVLVGLTGLGALALVDEIALRPATVGLLALLSVVVAAPLEPDRHRPGTSA